MEAFLHLSYTGLVNILCFFTFFFGLRGCTGFMDGLHVKPQGHGKASGFIVQGSNPERLCAPSLRTGHVIRVQLLSPRVVRHFGKTGSGYASGDLLAGLPKAYEE